MIASFAPGRNIKIGVTEWNTTAGDMGLKRAGLWDLHNALACARYMNLLQRNADIVEIANRSNLTNSFCSGIIQTNSQQIYFTPTYYVHWLYAKAANGTPLKIDPLTTLRAGLDVSAVRLDDGALGLFVVNQTNVEVDQSFDLPSEWALNRKCEVWKLADSLDQGDPNVTNRFDSPDRIRLVHSKGSCAGSVYKGQFPRLSVSLVVIK